MSIFRRFLKIVGAWGFLTILNIGYDQILYPFMIWRNGSLIGGGLMTLGSLAICFGMVIWYESTGTDWLGVSVVEDMKENGEGQLRKLRERAARSSVWAVISIALTPFSKFFLLVLWALKKNDILAFVALNIVQDPFVTTVFLRHGRFDGLRRRDWLVFGGSVLFSNGYWIARTSVLLRILGWLWKLI